MDTIHAVSCSNCGSSATRRHFTSNEAIYSCCPRGRVMQTECPVCDYLMVMCSLSGSVIEAYDSSTSATTRDLNRSKTSPTEPSQILALWG